MRTGLSRGLRVRAHAPCSAVTYRWWPRLHGTVHRRQPTRQRRQRASARLRRAGEEWRGMVSGTGVAQNARQASGRRVRGAQARAHRASARRAAVRAAVARPPRVAAHTQTCGRSLSSEARAEQTAAPAVAQVPAAVRTMRAWVCRRVVRQVAARVRARSCQVESRGRVRVSAGGSAVWLWEVRWQSSGSWPFRPVCVKRVW